MTLSNIKNNKERGFTIVELLIVIIVIGILATLVLIAYNNVQGQARDTKRQADASSLRDAAAAFKTQSTNGAYPQNGAGTGSGSFSADIASMSPQTISLDPSIISNINTSAPDSGNTNRLQIVYCPSTANAGSATGMKFVFWSETKGTYGTPPVTTGSGC